MAATNVNVLEKGTCCCVSNPPPKPGAVRVPLVVKAYAEQARKTGGLQAGEGHEVAHAFAMLAAAFVGLSDEVASIGAALMDEDLSEEEELPCRLVEDYSEDEADE